MPQQYMTQGQPGGFDFNALPKLPSLQDVLGESRGQAGIYKTLLAPQAQASSALPALQQLLLGSQAPAVQAIREGARGNVAATQSDMMRRGLTGSDIEASAMVGARAQGEQQVGQLIAQQSQTLAQYIMNALGLDIKVVLIDGVELARLMVENNLGVSIKQVYEVKQLDSDYFAEE